MRKTAWIFVALLLCLVGCRQPRLGKHPLPYYADQRGVYYWRTVFALSDAERNFLKEHKIKRLYVRFFDVTLNPDTSSTEKCIPVGTIKFRTPIPMGVEVVPVVFITPEAIRHHEEFTRFLAHRIYAMCQYNHIGFKEVQFDCDWTASTRESYFQFIKDVQAELKQFCPSVEISATIRLHQLAQTPPEVAYGTLMCYNTGDFKDFRTRNAILDMKDVKPYLKYLENYPLPLTLALPDYDWNVEFSANQEFMSLNKYTFDFSDKQRFQKTDRENVYKQMENGQLYRFVRHESSSAKEILDVKKTVSKARKADMPVTLYHLDSTQLSKYTDNEIKKFFR